MNQTPAINTSKPTSALAVFIIVAGIFAISSGAVLIRLALGEGMPSLLIAAGRVGIAALLLTPFVLRRYRSHLARLERQDLFLAGLSGTFLAIHFIAWVESLNYTSVLISVVFVSTAPLWVALLEFLVLRTQLSRLIIAGIFLAIFGGVIIGLGGAETESATTNLWGAFLSLVGAMTVSVYLIIGRKLRAKMAIIPYIWLVYGCAGIILLVILIISGTPVTGYSGNGYLFLLMMAIIPQLVGHSAINYVLGYFPATLVTLGAQLEPIGAAFLAYLVFQELPTPIQVLGSGVILAGVVMAILGQTQNQQKKQAS